MRFMAAAKDQPVCGSLWAVMLRGRGETAHYQERAPRRAPLVAGIEVGSMNADFPRTLFLRFGDRDRQHTVPVVGADLFRIDLGR